MPCVLRQLPDLRYLIVGDGSDRVRLEAKVRAHGLSKYVIFAGRIAEAEKVAHYNLADVYVMPEPWQALASRSSRPRPAAFRSSAVRSTHRRDALLDGQLGRMVDPSKPDELDRGQSLRLSGAAAGYAMISSRPSMLAAFGPASRIG